MMKTILVSRDRCMSAGLPAEALPGQEVAIRGRAEPMIIRAVKKAKALSALIGQADVVAA